jgi:hypothetical protein
VGEKRVSSELKRLARPTLQRPGGAQGRQAKIESSRDAPEPEPSEAPTRSPSSPPFSSRQEELLAVSSAVGYKERRRGGKTHRK